MERLHTMPAREVATYTCPACRRKIRVLADEYGDHGCICGWAGPGEDDPDVDEDETEGDGE
ncbi:hypothetical protein [Paenibacillus elgii]|uniref:hypothetical protein n=1 Tax=Paenibacillus elgii TaxID=189691 RepID=UPI000248C2E7|nr:hypothetical protein [Paenibacillus elgii]